MNEWKSNPGHRPRKRKAVDVELNVDDYAGNNMIFWRENPKNWDWATRTGVQIIRWKYSE